MPGRDLAARPMKQRAAAPSHHPYPQKQFETYKQSGQSQSQTQKHAQHQSQITHQRHQQQPQQQERQEQQQRAIDSALGMNTKSPHSILLQRRIQFRPPSRPDRSDENMRKLFVPINAAAVNSSGAASASAVGTNAGKANGDVHAATATASSSSAAFAKGVDENGFRRAAVSLCPRERILREDVLKWAAARKIGAGLANLGNTCFLNSVLQCLTYSPPLANILLSREHSKRCKAAEFCMFCELEKHVIRALGGDEKNPRQETVVPKNIVGRLKSIAKHLRFGKQEDAHEFLVNVVDRLQESCLRGLDAKLDVRIKETTLIHQIFGGYFQSQVQCLRCHHNSNTFDAFLQVCLEIPGASNLEKAFEHHIKPELLSGENQYKCEKCKTKCNAKKQLTVYRAPTILTVQLKRFTYNRFGPGKIGNQVSFNERLDIRKCMSQNSPYLGEVMPYSLYAVLVHAGRSCYSGHYYCYVKNSTGVWYCMNDESVHQVGLQTVLKQNAYLLFYVQDSPPQSSSSSIRAKMSKASSVPASPSTPAATHAFRSTDDLASSSPHPRTNGSVLGRELQRRDSMAGSGSMKKEQAGGDGDDSGAMKHADPAGRKDRGDEFKVRPDEGQIKAIKAKDDVFLEDLAKKKAQKAERKRARAAAIAAAVKDTSDIFGMKAPGQPLFATSKSGSTATMPGIQMAASERRASVSSSSASSKINGHGKKNGLEKSKVDGRSAADITGDVNGKSQSNGKHHSVQEEDNNDQDDDDDDHDTIGDGDGTRRGNRKARRDSNEQEANDEEVEAASGYNPVRRVSNGWMVTDKKTGSTAPLVVDWNNSMQGVRGSRESEAQVDRMTVSAKGERASKFDPKEYSKKERVSKFASLPVGSWEAEDLGTKVIIDKSGEPKRKRYRFDEMDVELDRGHVKKIKNKKFNPFDRISNPFQEFVNHKGTPDGIISK